MIKVALFDYDGTLANSDDAHFACWNRCLERFGAVIDTAFYIHHCVGKLSFHIAEQVIQRFPEVTITAADLATEKDQRFEQGIDTETIDLMPGARELLVYLAERQVITGIVSGAPLGSIQKTLQDHDITRYFRTIVTRESVTRGKPAPDCYLFALHELGSAASESASFEDSAAGVLAARNAGIFSFAIPSLYSKNHDFSAADAVCQDLFEAGRILDKMNDGQRSPR
jgi:HAD superfamily hydrolase (TIGR01509 family)